MNSGKEHQVALKHHIPVYIVYETVWVDEDGTVEFRDDVYGHDARQERILPASPIPGAIQGGQPRPGREARATPESVRATF